MLTTTPFEDISVRVAYECLRDFFDNFSVRSAVKTADSIIAAAGSKKIWKKDYPYQAIYFMEKLDGLCSAALVIHYSYHTRGSCILKTPAAGHPDLSLLQQFVAGNRVGTAWNSFPRHLTARQYHDPYRVIKKFAACMAENEWKNVLKLFIEYAFSTGTIDNAYPPCNVFNNRLHLLRLIEACHLLNVRSNLKAELKQKNKKL